VKELTAELNSTKQKLQQAETKASQPSAAEKSLQKEIASLKVFCLKFIHL
jgi:hypothetical protein